MYLVWHAKSLSRPQSRDASRLVTRPAMFIYSSHLSWVVCSEPVSSDCTRQPQDTKHTSVPGRFRKNWVSSYHRVSYHRLAHARYHNTWADIWTLVPGWKPQPCLGLTKPAELSPRTLSFTLIHFCMGRSAEGSYDFYLFF